MLVGKLGAIEIVLQDTIYEIYKLGDPNSFSVVTINALNRGITPCNFNIGIKDSNDVITWLEYGVEVLQNNVIIRTGVNLSPGDVIVASSTKNLCNIVITGSQSSNNISAIAFPQLTSTGGVSSASPLTLAEFGSTVISTSSFDAFTSPSTQTVEVNLSDGTPLLSVTNPNAPLPINFGDALAVTDFYLFVGAPNDANPTEGPNAGSVFVYETFSGSLVTTINEPIPAEGNLFGSSIEIDTVNGLLFISAPGVNNDTGVVYKYNLSTFVLAPTNNTLVGTAAGQLFGSKMALDATTLLVTAVDNVSVVDTVTMARVNTLPGVPGFGTSLAMNSDSIIIGSPNETVSGFNTVGQVYIHDRLTLAPITTISPRQSEIGIGLLFGSSVGVNSDLLWVGAPGYLSGTGKAYSYLIAGFSEVADVKHPNPVIGSEFGSVIVASEVKTIITAPKDTVAGAVEAGQAYTYRTNPTLFTTRVVSGLVTSDESTISQGASFIVTVTLDLPYADNTGFEVPWSISGYTDVVLGSASGVGVTDSAGTFNVTIDTKDFDALDYTSSGPQEIVFTSYGNSITLTVEPQLPSLYDFTSAKFTPGGQYGPTGPSLVQARSGLTGTGVDAWKTNTDYFNTSSGIQLWTVPQDGDYTIETWGARGGNAQSNNYFGGYGSRMKGTFTLVKGDILKILVGQMGGQSYGGGGGMTAVATTANTPLIVSGGGNTTSPWSSTIIHATTSTSGTPGQNQSNGGTSGNGGGAPGPNGCPNGGAGFFGNGTSSGGYNTPVPQSFVNGGNGDVNGCNNSRGGFGGGSASDGCQYGQSGAGGGYSGGGAGYASSVYSGAGGSYNSGVDQNNENGNSGTATLNPGQVIITLLNL